MSDLGVELFSLSYASAVLFVCVYILTLLFMWCSRVWRNQDPPGPTPIPLLGNVHQIAWNGVNNLQRTMADWGKKYGEIYTMYLGQERCIVLNSYEAIKEAFSMPSFTGRQHNFLRYQYAKNRGLTFVDGSTYSEQRRFSRRHLKDLGLGKSILELKILEEISNTLGVLEQENGNPYDINILLTHSVGNIVSSVLWGRRYDYSDTRFQSFLNAGHDIAVAMNTSATLDNIIPFARHLPGDLIGAKKLMTQTRNLENLIEQMIGEHKTENGDHQDSTARSDFVEYYLDQVRKDDGINDTGFTEEELISVLRDIFMAGIETVPMTLNWGILYFALNPDIQARVIKELDDVIGQDRAPSMRDRSNVPYMEACITEMHRLARILPTAVPHVPYDDVVIRGIAIAKGTTVVPNIAAISLNEDLFPEPYKFDPQRYLSADGKYRRTAAEKVIPFSIGNRVGIGESFAKMELFLLLASLLQKFSISVPEGAPLPSTDGIQGIAYQPQPYEFCFKLRA